MWVDADRDVRYDRILQAARGRVDDMVSYEEFWAQEDAEMHPASDDPFLINMTGVREIADIHVVNEFDSPESYRQYLIDHFELI